VDTDELNFQNPTSLQGELTVQQPNMLNAQLKEYQLKGLNWLATLYEQGINGILADEMGLGKTVQSIALIAHLAEKHDIWGPILVVSPTSTLHNWQQELARFVPKLKALPYWGPIKDRTTLRKIWCRKDITFDANAPFHILITSYNLVTQDQQYFQKLRWQYMILDEAQNIKNASSIRWKTLLGLNCRNRLLLTGTPIQNSMQGDCSSYNNWPPAILRFFQNSGLCSISSCRAFSTRTTNSTSGSRKTWKAQLRKATAV
jgi:DNA helicase INO80